MQITGAEAIVRALAVEQVPFVFGIVGGKLAPLLHAIAHEPSIRFVGARHEAAGVLMAGAVAAASERIAVAIAEMGPGSCNAIGGLGTAYANNLPLLLITSNNHHAASYPGRGMFMELDTLSLMRPLTKWNAVVHDGRRIPELLRTAFRQALSGRRGPVHLDVPQEILAAQWDYPDDSFELAPAAYRADLSPRPARDAIAQAAVMLAHAKRPLLLAGGGVVASGASHAFRALAQRLGAPAAATQMGIGVIASDAENFIGHGGIIGGTALSRALREADVILAVGCRFSSWMWDETGPLTGRGAGLINVNIDPAGLGLTPHALGMWSDAGTALEDLAVALDGHRPGQAQRQWLADMRAEYAGYSERLVALTQDRGDIMHPAALAQEIAAFLPGDALAVYDGGHTTFWSNDFTPAKAPRTRFHEPGMSQLGFGLPFANAIKLLHPGQPVFNITGDGSFGFTIQELDTARRHGLAVINVIHNNSSWGIIKLGQQKALGFNLGADLAGTDYAAVARGFGCFGESVERVEQVRPALERAMASGLPAVIDCRVRFEPHPCMPAFGMMNQYGFPAVTAKSAARAPA
ncbi:MAG: uncharacterized protein JWO28_2075 [Hyphomicrobiales bacterium]|nr:uncharacterized protein [Hyphomicrobiales bacterium]